MNRFHEEEYTEFLLKAPRQISYDEFLALRELFGIHHWQTVISKHHLERLIGESRQLSRAQKDIKELRGMVIDLQKRNKKLHTDMISWKKLYENMQCKTCSEADEKATSQEYDYQHSNPIITTMLAARAIIDAPAGVPEVKALREIGINAYLMHEQAKRENAGCIVGPMEAAATAIRDVVLAGVQSARPKGLPSIEELSNAGRLATNSGVAYQNLDSYGQREEAKFINAILAALAPYLREPTGWGLDLSDEEWADKCREFWTISVKTKDAFDLELKDFIKSRIRPTFECQECAEKDEHVKRVLKDVADYAAARAALEGE